MNTINIQFTQIRNLKDRVRNFNKTMSGTVFSIDFNDITSQHIVVFNESEKKQILVSNEGIISFEMTGHSWGQLGHYHDSIEVNANDLLLMLGVFKEIFLS